MNAIQVVNECLSSMFSPTSSFISWYNEELYEVQFNFETVTKDKEDYNPDQNPGDSKISSRLAKVNLYRFPVLESF